MKNEKPVFDLLIKAKTGDNDAKNKLLEMNNDLIIKIATTTFNEIERLYINYYGISNNYKLPNNVISLEDVIQDFQIKAIYIMNDYIKKSINKYFSVYLNHLLTSYKETYIKKNLKNILYKNNNEQIVNINNTFNQLVQDSNHKRLVDEIMQVIDQNQKLHKYKKFIQEVLNGLSYEELSTLFSIDTRNINRKLNSFINIYKKCNKDIIDKYNVDNVDISEMIKKGNIYQIPFYKYHIDNCLNSILKVINNNNFSYEYLKTKLLILFNNNINKYLQEKQFEINNFNEYFFIRLKYYKYFFINNYNNEIYNTSINKEMEILDLIKYGYFYTIPFYKKFVDKEVNNIYNYLKESCNISYQEVFNHFFIIVDKIILNYLKNNVPDITSFNNYLIQHVRINENNFIKGQIHNKRKTKN